jgi:hypothetical protein
MNGGAVTVLASNQDHPADIATDGSYVYWINLGPATGVISINRVPVTGGPPGVLASFVQPSFGGGWGSIALDGDSVCYVNSETHTLMKMAKDGTSQTAIVAISGVVLGLAVDSTSVYWLDSRGSIMKLAK